MLDHDGSGFLSTAEFVTSMQRLVHCDHFQNICMNRLQFNQVQGRLQHLDRKFSQEFAYLKELLGRVVHTLASGIDGSAVPLGGGLAGNGTTKAPTMHKGDSLAPLYPVSDEVRQCGALLCGPAQPCAIAADASLDLDSAQPPGEDTSGHSVVGATHLSSSLEPFAADKVVALATLPEELHWGSGAEHSLNPRTQIRGQIQRAADTVAVGLSRAERSPDGVAPQEKVMADATWLTLPALREQGDSSHCEAQEALIMPRSPCAQLMPRSPSCRHVSEVAVGGAAWTCGPEDGTGVGVSSMFGDFPGAEEPRGPAPGEARGTQQALFCI